MIKKRAIAERYASALLNVARERDEVEKILEELRFLKRLLIENINFRRFLESPHISQKEKMEFVQNVLSPHLTRTSLHFIMLLVKKYRLLYLSEIIEEYEALYDKEQAIQRVDVISACSIDRSLSERLQGFVERLLEKNIKLNFYIDPRIIGGLIIKTPSLLIDGSVRKKLRDLQYAITSSKI